MWGSAGWSPESHYEAWPLALPRQAEVITAHLVPELARGASSRCQGLQALLRLAETGEPIGGAMTVAVAHLLNGAHTETRAAGVDAVLALAARERLDGAALGARLAAMVLQGEVTAKRLAGPLMDAARAGAAAETWSTFHRLLADLLADGQPVTGMVDLLTGAATVAELVPGPTPISGLAELAARKGRSGQVLEARRLAGLLTG
jgi:hypothetical protein